MDKHFLEQCERESLHFSGAILPHGSLLVLDRQGCVSHVSANIADHFGRLPETWLGAPLPDHMTFLLDKLSQAPGSRRVAEALLEGNCGALDAVVIRGEQGQITLEFSPTLPTSPAPTGTQQVLPQPPTTPAAVHELQQALVEEIADQSGFQRVMFYAFREDADGEVVAEARRGAAYGSYLGLRFPASDIPQIARTLYLRNPWRLIPDATLDPVPVVGRESNPPDLTWSDLRSVSPVHQTYLANMGVRASLSFPVVIGGNLTALIAAHHCEARRLAPARLDALAARVRNHAFAVANYQAQRRMHLIDGLAYRFDEIKQVLQRTGDIWMAWPVIGEWLMEEFEADGALLSMDDMWGVAGKSLEPLARSAFENWFDQQSEFVWSGDHLAHQVPGFPLSEIAGALALRVTIPGRGELRIIFVRTEYVHEVAWGGNPEKPVEHHDGALGIAPRRSFEKWVEKRMGVSRPWSNETRLLALRLRDMFRQISFPDD